METSEPQETRRCSNCSRAQNKEVFHTVDHFASDKTRKSGYRTSCKVTVNERQMEKRIDKEAEKPKPAKYSYELSHRGIDYGWAHDLCNKLLKLKRWDDVCF